MQSDAIARLRQILADEPHAGEMIVHLDDLSVFGAPRARNGVGRYPGEAEAGQGLHLVAAGEAAGRIDAATSSLIIPAIWVPRSKFTRPGMMA